MMRLTLCLVLIGAAGALRAKAMAKDFSWPWDKAISSHHDTPAFPAVDSSDSTTSGGDFMDQYIKESGGKPADSDPQPLSSSPSTNTQNSAVPDMATLFGGSDGDSSSSSSSKVHSDETPAWSKSSSSSGSSMSDANDDAGIFRWPSSNDHGAAAQAMFHDRTDASSSSSDVSQPQQAPQQDAPVQKIAQVDGSVQGASATDQVVDVRLSSELQQSLLQARSAEAHMLARFRRN